MAAPLTKDQRAALVASLRSLPAAMRDKPHWLVWKYLIKDPAKKPAKMPYYLNGKPRGWPNGRPANGKPTEDQPQVHQGHELDRSHLVAFEEALAALESAPRWQGIGYAFLPGDGLVGVDIDDAINEDGEISDLAQFVMQSCPGYTELSPSGRGMHIILSGEVESFKSDEIGLEIYCGHQYFTCTGTRWGAGAEEPVPASMFALDVLRAKCEQANEVAKQRKAAERAEKQAASGEPAVQTKPRAAATRRAAGEKGTDFQLVNERALANLSAWVPALFSTAREYATKFGPGYRVRSVDLNRDLQEDLAITPGGIQDWGTRVGMSAVDVVVEWGKKTPYEALLWLADRVGVRLEKRAPAHAPAPASRRQTPPPEGEPPAPVEREESAAHNPAPPDADPRPKPSEPPPSPPAKKARRKRKGAGEGGGDDDDEPSRINWAHFEHLRDTFAYQYGSDIAWDCDRRESITITNLRHTFGSDTVRYWMTHAERRMLFKEDVMFEPGQDLGPDKLNLFRGLELEPVEGDASVMVELLRYLCSTSVAPGMGPEDIADWVLKWCAYPLQNMGAKLVSACVFYGPHGTGKNLYWDCIRSLYGRYGVMIGQTELEEKNNAWMSGNLLIVGDEVVSRQELEHGKNRLKWMISADAKIPIRAMYADTRWESNHVQLVFLSNEPKPVALENGDRRYMVVYTPPAARDDLYARVAKFLNEENGAAKFLHFLQHLPLDDFGPHIKPPLTEAKANLIELGMKPPERFMHEWLGGYLPLPMQPCTAEQLYTCFRRWCEKTGERFPPRQADFTEQAKRYALERIDRDEHGGYLEPAFIYKPVQVPDAAKATGRKAYRCWIPRGCGPRELAEPGDDDSPMFRTEGEWMRWCIEGFDKIVWGFMRTRYRDEEEGRDDA